MAKFDVEAFLTPVSDSERCGRDLDLDGDADYMNFVARAEGLLPQSFFTFERGSIDFAAEVKAIEALLDRTRDLRLVVLHAKFSILNRDLDGYVTALEIVAAASEQLWAEVHPRGEGRDQILRVATVHALDDLPDSIMPLQFVPLVENRRTGPITWRMRQIATGKLAPRADEATLDVGTVERAFLDADLPALIERRDRFAALKAAADRIDTASLEHGDFENRIDLERLKAISEEIATFLDEQVGRREPAAMLKPAVEAAVVVGETDDAPQPAPADGPGRPAALTDRRAALRALASAGDYFANYEPSSPALLLIRFARKIAGRSLHDVIRIMMPDMVGRAAIPVVPSMFRVSLEKLTDTADYAGDLPREDDVLGDDGEAPAPAPTNRRDALRLLELVATFFRAAEPASPLPLILARARDLAERDFQTLLKELFTESALQSLKGDEWR